MSSSTPTADFTPGVAATRASCCSVITLLMMSEAPFCATVKSALPTWRMAAADVRRLSVTSPRVSTVPTPTATATAVSSERTRLAHTLWNASPSQRNDHLQLVESSTRAMHECLRRLPRVAVSEASARPRGTTPGWG